MVPDIALHRVRTEQRVAGAADNETIRLGVRRAVREETLADGGTLVSQGNARPCHICGEIIHRREIDHEVPEAGGPVAVHSACLRIWGQESLTLALRSDQDIHRTAQRESS